MIEAVGFHCFEWCDEPREGWFDGEKSDYGLVNIKDQPYEWFVTTVRTANRDELSLHRKLTK